MKLRLCCLIMLVCMLAAGASADMMHSEEYTDVTSVMTQDSVVRLEVFTDDPEAECSITLQQPDEKSMGLLEDIYDFVWREVEHPDAFADGAPLKNAAYRPVHSPEEQARLDSENPRPARYYDRETQQKIQALVPGMDIDALYLTEFMAQEMHGTPTGEVVVERLLDVDYQPGQLVIVVLGYEQENGAYRWFPYLGEVPELGMIRYTIPAEDYIDLSGRPQVIYHVLTVRVGPRGGVLSGYEEVPARQDTPSKSADDLTRVRRWHSTTGETIEDDFRIFTVDMTPEMQLEIGRIGNFLAEELPDGETNPIIRWFPEENIREAQLLLGADVDCDALIGYDIIAVMSENYRDTYGDVATESGFAAAYSPEHSMVVMLGFPLPEDELPDLPPDELEKTTHFRWYCLRAEAFNPENAEDFVEILFKQLVIPTMETEPALLVVLSEPLDEPAAAQ